MLHYEISGNQPETLVLLHGFMENSSMWVKMEDALIKKFRLVKIDLPGHGKSESFCEEHSMDLMAEEVYKVCLHLELNQFHLLGHSMGGYVALAFTSNHPKVVKSLGLFFSSFLPDDAEKIEIRKKSLRIISENFAAYAHAGIPNLFDAVAKDQLKEEIEFAEQMALQTPNDGVLAAVKGMMNRPNRKHVINEFNNKILFILGNADTAVNAELLLAATPKRDNIRIYTIACGHMGHLEKPNICSEIILNEF